MTGGGSVFAATRQRVRQGGAVDELQFATDRHAVGNTRRAYGRAAGDIFEVMGGRLAFHGRAGRHDHFADLAARETPFEDRNLEPVGCHTVDRRQASPEYEVASAIIGRLFDRYDIERVFHHANETRIAVRAVAQLTDVSFAKCTATRTLSDFIDGALHDVRQPACFITMLFEQVKGNPLRGLRADPGKKLKRGDELGE